MTCWPSAVVLVRMSYWPITMNARYVAIGRVDRQLQRLQPLMTGTGGVGMTPLLSTSVPLGTITEMSNVALSSGWSLLGNHHHAISGSPTASAPSGVRVHATKPAACTADGMPEYCTTTVIAAP